MSTDHTFSHGEELAVLYGAADELSVLDLTLEKVLALTGKGVSLNTILKAAEWETMQKNHLQRPFMTAEEIKDLMPKACCVEGET